MANRIVNFQMQQPGEMQQPQAVGNQQQKRQSLADRLRRYGAGQDSGEGASTHLNSNYETVCLRVNHKRHSSNRLGKL